MKQILEKIFSNNAGVGAHDRLWSAADKEIMTAKEFQKKWKGWD